VMLSTKQYEYPITNQSKSWLLYITWIEYIIVWSRDILIQP
jgi:hypothetical protein